MKFEKILIFITIILIPIIIMICFRINKNQRKNKIIVDSTIPVIKTISDEIYLDYDNEFDPLSNISTIYGISGGKTKCEKIKLEVGENVITCTAKGKNGLTSKINYKVIVSKTYQKKAIFFGDSIVYGFASSPVGYSWANYIGDNYDLALSVNAGINDYRVSTYDDVNKWLVNQVISHYNDENNYDFVILQGGINDVFYNTPLGEVSKSKNADSFDPNTFCGGLESYLFYVTNKWRNARIGYIITYNTPNYTENNLNFSYKEYYDKTIQILDKWHIKYLDLTTKTFDSLLKVNEKTYLPDYLHLNNAGYNIISPYIYEFMQTLEKYM